MYEVIIIVSEIFSSVGLVQIVRVFWSSNGLTKRETKNTESKKINKFKARKYIDKNRNIIILFEEEKDSIEERKQYIFVLLLLFTFSFYFTFNSESDIVKCCCCLSSLFLFVFFFDYFIANNSCCVENSSKKNKYKIFVLSEHIKNILC